MGEGKVGGFCSKIGWCLSFLLLCIAIGAFACALAVTTGCDFVVYEPQEVPKGVQEEVPKGFENVTYTNIGLFQYDPDKEGCRKISDDFDDLGWQLTTARIGNALAVIVGGVAMLMHLVDLALCRFPCSRVFICIFFVVAFIAQALTFLIFATNVCDANFKNAPYPCTPDTACYISIAATVLFFIASCLACCFPKPEPLIHHVREHLKTDETDSCFILCQKAPPKDEEEDMEKGPDEKEKQDTTTEEDVEEMPDDTPMTQVAVPVEDPELKALEEQEARAAIVTALAAARQLKQQEIEQQLEMLTQYKEYLPEEEYNEKMAKLLVALPDPETYDTCTKTAMLAPQTEEEKEMEELEQEEEEDGEGVEVQQESKGNGDEKGDEEEEEINVDDMDSEEGEEAEGEEEPEEEKKKKKKGVGAAFAATGGAIAGGFTKMKKGLSPHKKSPAEAPAQVPQDTADP